MPLPTDQIDELKLIAANIAVCDEGGVSFILLPSFKLPDGCSPCIMDLLLCPASRDGYESRLFFSEKVVPAEKVGRTALNWNGSVRIAERNWQAFSWRTPAGLRFAQMLSIHLKALQ
jgi:hypothetical protein